MAGFQNVLELTAKIVSAYLARNQAAPDALPGLIQGVHGALAGAGAPLEVPAQEPAALIWRSVFPDHIVCLENGGPFALLKRHLRTEHAMTPAEYRAKWGLPASYPMTAPNYASRRSELARRSGLGHKATMPATAPSAGPAVRKMPARRARGSKG